MTLKDYDIKSSSTLTVTKFGVTLDVINPQVRTVIFFLEELNLFAYYARSIFASWWTALDLWDLILRL